MNHPLPTLALATAAFFSFTAAPLGVAQEEGVSAEPEIVVIGSSVAAGWVTGREARQDLQNGWAARLKRLLAARGRTLVNVSRPGDDTKAVLDRLEEDLLNREPRYAIVGLSMANEGLETEDPGEVFASYEEGIGEIIDICRESAIQPVIGLCYPNDNFTEEQCEVLEEMNLLLQSLSVPTIDFLGPLDDGHGNFVRGFTFDLDHPDDLGHREMFHAIVPSLFDALEAGKPAPERASSDGHLTVGGAVRAAPVVFVPDEVMHAFTVTFRIRCVNEGAVGAIDCGERRLQLQIDGTGRLGVTLAAAALRPEKKLTDGDWHEVVIVHRHLRGETELWLDGASVGRLEGTLVPRRFVLGGPLTVGKETSPPNADYRELVICRTAWTERGVEAFHEGALLPASLEVYAPLRGELPERGGTFENLAQSTAELHFHPADLTEALARLEARIEATANEPRWIDPDRLEPITLDEAVLARYVGDYEANPQVTLFVTLEKGRLIFSPGGQGKTELHAASETEFFLRVMGPPPIPVVFELDDDGKVTGMLFDEGVSARRID